MNEQYDTTNEQAQDGLTTRDIVSAGQRPSTEPRPRQGDAVSPATSQPADGVAPGAPIDQQTARDQSIRENIAHATTPPARQGGVNQGGAPTEGNRVAGSGADLAPMRAAEQRGRGGASLAPLLSSDATGAFQARWDAVQTAFIDEPRQVVEQADKLVAELMQQLAKTFAQERSRLEQQWEQSGDVSTEDLRLALQRYRSFFQRLLSA